MAFCELCGKHTGFGNKVAKVRTGLYSRTPRLVKPNLRHATICVGGKARRVTACARCIRTANHIRQ